MNKNLFEMSDIHSGLNEVIAGYFNIMSSDRNFIEATEYIIKKIGFNSDGAYCNFPDMNSYDESEHFEGVEFSVGYPASEADAVIVSEEICYQYVRLACERYVKLHPEDAEKIKFLLDTISN
ncbi:ribonuclease toxin immunity protein CdiI [Pectobacterium aroidearum]|uniref:ribonuclease toxin immunity protein CdiI n=1 Tax=Pectobacterium aroidearum TaxID=1201031 RepID=UPI0015DD6907|nr:ribonuclease toxin immunity protein CdiI [Pectobacterium aroidearum]MBA0206318.1 ribonuclease toxin immunity protein CdiI [Pectobacterium aroidearum]